MVRILEHLTHLLLGRGDWLREPKEWKCEIDETVLVILELVLSIDHLVVAFENKSAASVSENENEKQGKNDQLKTHLVQLQAD